MSRSTSERGDMRHYRHLGAEERDRIAEMYARHEGVPAIAAAIGRNKSTASREIARNGRNGRCVVSFSTICRAVNAGELDPPQAAPEERVRGRLRRRGRRPREADARSRLGGWEDDTVVGPTPACLVTMAGRASRLPVGGRARAHSSAEAAEVEARALAGRPLEAVTPDRGKEFASHREASRALGRVPFCFCQPHRPWQKPTAGNTNGLIREFFPKGTDFSRVTDEEVQEVFEKINGRPRKVLGFRTANEVYREMLHSA